MEPPAAYDALKDAFDRLPVMNMAVRVAFDPLGFVFRAAADHFSASALNANLNNSISS